MLCHTSVAAISFCAVSRGVLALASAGPKVQRISGAPLMSAVRDRAPVLIVIFHYNYYAWRRERAASVAANRPCAHCLWSRATASVTRGSSEVVAETTPEHYSTVLSTAECCTYRKCSADNLVIMIKLW
jgi:hypothetical protein